VLSSSTSHFGHLTRLASGEGQLNRACDVVVFSGDATATTCVASE
jgi:hypothetical protein